MANPHGPEGAKQILADVEKVLADKKASKPNLDKEVNTWYFSDASYGDLGNFVVVFEIGSSGFQWGIGFEPTMNPLKPTLISLVHTLNSCETTETHFEHTCSHSEPM